MIRNILNPIVDFLVFFLKKLFPLAEWEWALGQQINPNAKIPPRPPDATQEFQCTRSAALNATALEGGCGGSPHSLVFCWWEFPILSSQCAIYWMFCLRNFCPSDTSPSLPVCSFVWVMTFSLDWSWALGLCDTQVALMCREELPL